MKKVSVIGAGSWGTALALTAHRAGQQVTLITRQAEQAALLNQTRENKTYLPGIRLPPDLYVTSDLKELVEADIALSVIPVQYLREACVRVQPYLPSHVPWVICAKGIAKGDQGSPAQLLTELCQEILPNPMVVLSGPSFADEVGKNLPTAVTVASHQEDMAKFVAVHLRHSRFRCYVSHDPIGVQVAGALKNVLAIACGIVRGKNLGNNAVAALMTRGLAEIRRLGLALGGEGDTFLGLSGVGDVTLTCSSEQSRNMRLGKAIGQKGDVTSVLKQSSDITEGVPTVAAVYGLAQSLSIPLPLCEAMYAVLYQNVPIDQVIEDILSRQSEREF